MRIEVTGKINGVTENIRSVSEDLEYSADYPVRLSIPQLDRETYLALKRLEHLGLPLRITIECPQMMLPETLPDPFQETLEDVIAGGR